MSFQGVPTFIWIRIWKLYSAATKFTDISSPNQDTFRKKNLTLSSKLEIVPVHLPVTKKTFQAIDVSQLERFLDCDNKSQM